MARALKSRGNFGHAGRPGLVGGASKTGSSVQPQYADANKDGKQDLRRQMWAIDKKWGDEARAVEDDNPELAAVIRQHMKDLEGVIPHERLKLFKLPSEK